MSTQRHPGSAASRTRTEERMARWKANKIAADADKMEWESTSGKDYNKDWTAGDYTQACLPMAKANDEGIAVVRTKAGQAKALAHMEERFAAVDKSLKSNMQQVVKNLQLEPHVAMRKVQLYRKGHSLDRNQISKAL